MTDLDKEMLSYTALVQLFGHHVLTSCIHFDIIFHQNYVLFSAKHNVEQSEKHDDHLNDPDHWDRQAWANTGDHQDLHRLPLIFWIH